MSEYALYQLAGNELESPLINAAGSINGTNEEVILREVKTLAATSIGGITVGSFTVLPHAGNEVKFGTPTYYHSSDTGETFNSMGLPNIGKDAAVALAPEITEIAHDTGKIVIYSASPTISPESGTSIEQALELIYDFLQTDVDKVEVNVSCPNVVTEGGGRKPIMGYDLETMHELTNVIKDEIGDSKRLAIKLPPYLSIEERLAVPDIASLIVNSRAFCYLVTANTIPGQAALGSEGVPMLSVPGSKGGMSGPATRMIGREQLSMWYNQLGDSIDIVSALGVDTGDELKTRLDLGAVAASGVTFLWESQNWGNAVSDMLTEYAESI